jgi:hypothetical protein
MRGIVVRPAATLMVLSALLTGVTRETEAEFMFISESAVFNPDTGDVNFTIEFNQVPDFLSVDSVGRQANSFQYFIIGDASLPYPENYDAIFRGEEIHITGDTLRIRDSRPSDSDPIAGGWGAIRGSVPYSLFGNVVAFSAPLSLISDHSTDGSFRYELESSVYGSTTRHVVTQSTGWIVPEPSTAVHWVVGGLITGCWYGRSRGFFRE